MIIKGNIRAGGQNLAKHLTNTRDNDSVDVSDVRGFVADDLSGAFAEIEAVASATKGTKPIYSMSLNPSEPLTREQYAHAIDTIETKLGFTDQPRAVVFHVKDGREHVHVAWSRVDAEKLQIIHMEFDRQKLRECAITLAREFGHELPDGLANDRGTDRFKDRFNETNWAEKGQEQRTGMSKAERVQTITEAYRQSDNAQSFTNALDEHGFALARGDRRGFVVVDMQGEVHSLGRCIEGETTKSIKAMLKLDDVKYLPSIQAVKDGHACSLREKATEKPRDAFNAQRQADVAEAHLKALRDAHIAEMKAMNGEHTKNLKAMAEQEAERIREARKAVRDAYKPEWAQMFKAQRAEMEAINGHLKNPVTRLKWMMNNPDYELLHQDNHGHLSKVFKFIVHGDHDLTKVERRHEAERKDLAAMRKLATAAEISDIKLETKSQRHEMSRDHREQVDDRTLENQREITAAERNLKAAREAERSNPAHDHKETAQERSTRERQGFGKVGFGKQGFEKQGFAKEREKEDDERERFMKPPGQSFTPG